LDKLLPAWILGCGCEREKTQQITRLFNRLGPILGGCGKEEPFEFLLPSLQSGMFVLDLDTKAPKFGRLLGRYPAVCIEFGRFLRHQIHALRNYILATILPAGVAISPPITSWIKPSSTRRALRPLGIVRLIKPVETSRSAENSKAVRSDFVGIRFIRKKTRLCCAARSRRRARVEPLDATSFRPVRQMAQRGSPGLP
jgi:hypothetical protein